MKFLHRRDLASSESSCRQLAQDRFRKQKDGQCSYWKLSYLCYHHFLCREPTDC